MTNHVEGYASYRRRVEAAHAAAKDERLWSGPMGDVVEDIRPALNAHPGIDMEYLGEMCREEPSEADKQAVAEMMDGLTGRIGAQP